jgi:hypothetical protein
MELVLATYGLAQLGGSETYLSTVAWQLQRLGHEVTIFAVELGDVAEQAQRTGLRVAGDEADLPEAPDALLVQDNVCAYRLAERYPSVPQLFVAHSDTFDLQLPPRLPDLVGAIVVLNERTRRRAKALALDVEVVRLRQPVDIDRFSPRGPIAERPRRALLLGNYLQGQRRDLLVEAFEAAGVEVRAIGRHGEGIREGVEHAIAEVDIVVGKARAILEAMACGRAAYVYDWNGSDGWVTPERYPLLEADNFGGQAEPTVSDPGRLRADLDAYRPQMGVANRDLAVANHSAVPHAHELVALMRRLAPRRARPSGSLQEMAWLARQNWALESRFFGATFDAQHAREIAESARGKAADARAQADTARAERDAACTERDAARAELQAVLRQRRFRVGAALARPLDIVRSRWRA